MEGLPKVRDAAMVLNARQCFSMPAALAGEAARTNETAIFYT